MPELSESCRLRTRMFRFASKIGEGDGGHQTHRGADQGDADVVGDLLGLDFLAGADASERGHHAQDRAEQPQQRTALDDRGDPTEPRFQVGEDLPLHEFGDQLAELRFVQLAVFDGGQGQLGQRPLLGLADFGRGVEIAVFQVVLHLAEELRLRLLAGESQGEHAAPQQDHAKQPPEKITGQKHVTGVSELRGQIIDVVHDGLPTSRISAGAKNAGQYFTSALGRIV